MRIWRHLTRSRFYRQLSGTSFWFSRNNETAGSLSDTDITSTATARTDRLRLYPPSPSCLFHLAIRTLPAHLRNLPPRTARIILAVWSRGTMMIINASPSNDPQPSAQQYTQSDPSLAGAAYPPHAEEPQALPPKDQLSLSEALP